jgi:ribosomal protein S18 acetylase RimI-like enzyme
MNDIVIEYFRRKHIRHVAKLETVAFTILHEPLVSKELTHGRFWGMSLIAADDQAIVGYVEAAWFFEPHAVRGQRSLYIMAVAFDGSLRPRTRGISERLLHGVFARAGARGARSFHVRVQADLAADEHRVT